MYKYINDLRFSFKTITSMNNKKSWAAESGCPTAQHPVHTAPSLICQFKILATTCCRLRIVRAVVYRVFLGATYWLIITF